MGLRNIRLAIWECDVLIAQQSKKNGAFRIDMDRVFRLSRPKKSRKNRRMCNRHKGRILAFRNHSESTVRMLIGMGE